MLVHLEQQFVDSVLVRDVVLDTDARTVSTYDHGALVSEVPATTADFDAIPVDRGLPADGKLATAFAVLGLLPVADAASLVGLPAQALVDEALAWGVAGQ